MSIDLNIIITETVTLPSASTYIGDGARVLPSASTYIGDGARVLPFDRLLASEAYDYIITENGALIII